MKHTWTTIAVAACLSGAVAAQEQDAFPREGSPAQRQKKDALEGKPPPGLAVRDWMNTDGEPLSLDALRGKVVLLDFWGVW